MDNTGNLHFTVLVLPYSNFKKNVDFRTTENQLVEPLICLLFALRVCFVSIVYCMLSCMLKNTPPCDTLNM